MHSKVKITRTGDDDRYTADIKYEYRVDGTTHDGERVYFDLKSLTSFFEPSYNLRSEAYDIVDDYPCGATVDVYYDPDDPGQAVLERRIDTTALMIALGGGALGLVIGLGAIAFGLIQTFSDKRIDV